MSRSRATTPKLPCRRCGVPHEQRIAQGGGLTFRAVDGHAYEPTEETVEPTENPCGFTNVFFGALAECDICGACVENRRAAMDRHAAWHAPEGGAA